VRSRIIPVVVLAWAAAAAAMAVSQAEAAVPDAYIEGYAAAILRERFGLSPRSLTVQDGVIALDAGDLAGADAGEVAAALARIQGAVRVDIRRGPRPARAPDPERPAPRDDRWQTGPMPGGTLFKPLIADPRWPHFSAAHQRYLDDPDFGDVASVSFGETFALWRGRRGEHWWEVGIQAGVFAILDMDAESFDLINADYFVAAALGYRRGQLSALGRLFHQSSHLGDEFLLRRSRVDRINLSYEGLDGRLSYDLWDDVVRLYGGAGYLVRREPADLAPWSLQYGVELRSPWPEPGAGFRPIAAADFQHREENDWSADISVRAGVQFGGVLLSRDLQLLLEYFTGRSPNGQFYRRQIDYLGIGVHFHF
jgi:hypothetical protein